MKRTGDVILSPLSSASAPLKILTEFCPASSVTVVPYRIASAFVGFPRDPDAYLRRFVFGPSA
jgi:hypothetical protein